MKHIPESRVSRDAASAVSREPSSPVSPDTASTVSGDPFSPAYRDVPVQPAAMPHWVPNLRTQNRKKPPFDMPGHRKACDYDCGDADQEMDPAIEESFLLRMIPGRDCDYLRKIIERGEHNTAPVQVPDQTGCTGGEGAGCLN
jgi:hypothetical protein